MAQIDEHVTLGAIEAARLRLNTQPCLEKQLERIGDGIESLHMEVQDVSAFERLRARQEQQKAQWLIRRQEVRARRCAATRL
jgi:C-terminal region of eIF3h